MGLREPALWRRVLHLGRPYRNKLILIVLMAGVSAAVTIVWPFMLRQVLDVAIPQQRIGLLSALALSMIAVSVVTSVVAVCQTTVAAGVGLQVMNGLRTSVYAHLESMPLKFFVKTKAGDIQSRIINDIGAMQATVTSTSIALVRNSTSVIATLSAMLALDWRLTLCSLPLFVVLVVISRKVGQERKDITTERQKQLSTMTGMIGESLSVSGVLLSRTMNRGTSLIEAFRKESALLADLDVGVVAAGRWRMSSINILLASAPVALYWGTGATMGSGESALTIGTVIAFVALQQLLVIPTVQLFSSGVQIQTSMALFQRIFEYLDLEPDLVEPLSPIELRDPRGEVRFEDVVFAYDGDGGPALEGIDLTVPAGSCLAIVGATGSGKTTLGYLIPRLFDVDRGRVSVDDVDVRDLSFSSLADTVGLIAQESYFFNDTIAQNLRFARPEASDAELVAAAEAARIHDFIATLPDGYNTVLGDRGQRLSGGEKQRLAIARTILRDPRILVLDEATSALDTSTEIEVQKALDTLFARRTRIIIAHRLSTIRHADQIVVLDRGHIVERGTHDQLLVGEGRYADLVRDSVSGPAHQPSAT
ncbi:ABC transporter ATP-binding protein [Streptomyces sp. NPDC013161]|uniref:ABC transporter ATP-binding protein n=1 Tax=Streptomyces sp. NPDC013161 TaxID=3364862 RepID=UPI003683FDE3